jgi:hypothetical protein
MEYARVHKLRVLLALGYLALGLTAAWHAPHFSQARSALSVDHHVQHEAALGEECALCTAKTTPQLGVARFGHKLAARTVLPVEGFRLPVIMAAGGFSGRPRAPPSFS